MENYYLNVNGNNYKIVGDKNESLLNILREKLNLTGAKCGCETGTSGTCKVIIDGKAIKSCRVKGFDLQKSKIETIEGLADGYKLHPIQEAFIEAGAIQCGFCTPAMILTTKALLNENKNPTEEEIRFAFRENLCRCTGYVQIVEAVKIAAEKLGGV
ncbi:MAG TPA: (2Fe-2S)-binding protein [Gallicola sp.]|nr:(2Fe-2S)-binding protein [Gallicola sp.]